MTDTQDVQTLSFAEKIAKAIVEVGGKLAPDKTNREQNYDYVSADKIISIGGAALAEQGVVIIPSILSQTITPYDRPNKSPRLDAYVQLDMLLTDGESHQHVLWIGFGSDYMTPDKAIYKAITSGHKYFLSKLLMIGAGNEDSEHEDGDKPAPKKAPVTRNEQNQVVTGRTTNPPTMTLETAKLETSADGTLYWNLTSKALSDKTIGISKMLNKNDLPREKREEYQRKFDAIAAIFEYRKGLDLPPGWEVIGDHIYDELGEDTSAPAPHHSDN